MASKRCLKTLLLLSDYYDGDLSGHMRVQLQVHLGACPHCERAYRTLARTIVLFKAYAHSLPCHRGAAGNGHKGDPPVLD